MNPKDIARLIAEDPDEPMVRINILINDRIEGFMWAKNWKEWWVDNQGNWFDFVIPQDKAQALLDSAATNDSYIKATTK